MTKEAELIAAKFKLGLLLREDLPNIAVQLMQGGLDTPSLRILAGLTPLELDNAAALLVSVFNELGVLICTNRQAIVRLACRKAKEIIDETVSPYDGAKFIWDAALSQDTEYDEIPEIHPFIYAASEWEDRPKDRLFFEAAIVDAAKDLMSGLCDDV